MSTLQESRVLVLNADYRPLSYYPLSTLSWKDAVKAIFMERVNIVEYYDRFVRSPSQKFQLPSVIALKEYIAPKSMPAFTRFNVFLRDDFTCQYTGEKLPAAQLTFDHVIPRSKGGGTNWENIVTASQHANLRKGSKMPNECHMYPRQKPYQPTTYELREKGRQYPPSFLHETWHDYLYWDTELEKDDF